MKTPTKVLLAVASAAVVLGAVGSLAWQMNRSQRSYFTDAQSIKVRASDAPIRSILWQPSRPVQGDIRTSADEYEPRVSADGTTMVFVRGRAGANADLFSCRWTPEGWTAPEAIAAVNTPQDELGPELSRDGKRLYFYSDRDGGLGGYDLWVSYAIEGGWGSASNLGPTVNTEFNEYGPALSPDGAMLCFSTNRPRPGEPRAERDAWPATIREQRTRHDYDLYRAAVSESGPGEAAPVLQLNTTSDEGSPAFSPSGDFFYFASNRPGGSGGFDIYRARILSGRWQAPEGLGSAINSAANDLDPSLSADGFRLFFSTNRPVAGDAAPDDAQPTDYSLWCSASREVFLEVEPANAGELALKLLRAAWPWLALLLVSCLSAALLYYLLRNTDVRSRYAKLSLLAKCFIVSLAIHALLASMMAAWKVGGAIGNLMRPGGGGTRVVLASAGVGGIAGQIRAAAATIAINAPTISPARFDAPVAGHIDTPSVLFDSPAPVVPAAAPASFPTPQAAATPPSAVPPRTLAALSPDTQPLPARTPATAGPAEAVPEATPDAPTANLAPLPASPRLPASTVPTIEVTPTPLQAPSPAAPLETSFASEAPPARSVTASAPVLPSRIPEAQAAGARLPAVAAPVQSATEAPAAAPIASVASTPAPTSMGGSAEAPTVSIHPIPITAVQLPGLQLAPGAIEAAPVSAVSVGSGPSLPDDRSSDHGTAIARVPGSDQVARGPGAEAIEAAAPGPTTVIAPLTGSPMPVSGGSRQAGQVPTQIDPGAIAPMFASTPSPRSPVGSVSEASAPASPIPLAPSMLAPPGPPGEAIALRLPPTEESPAGPVEDFAQRSPEVRADVLEKMGGTPETERAVALALEWFQRHQGPDGSWSGRHFDDRCGECKDASEFEADAAMTGMTLLCYLGAGHTHKSEGPYRELVRRSLAWLVARETEQGDLRRGETMYSQTIATVALCEAYAMTRDPWLEGPARRAASFVATGARTRTGGSTDAGDTSVLGWRIMAIKSAQRCGFPVQAAAFDATRTWLNQVAGNSGRYAYKRGDAPNAAATAEAMFVQQLLGRSRAETQMKDSARFILDTPPSWRNGAPTYYWYYATLALFQQQGEAWQEWNHALAKELLDNQQKQGAAAGSWDPQDRWSRMGGRIYQTAVCTLSLEVYYRYKPAGIDFAPER